MSSSNGSNGVLRFDFSQLTGHDIQEYRVNTKETRYKLMVRIVVAAPKAWGDPADEKTYSQMKRKLWISLVRDFDTALAETRLKDIPGLRFDVEDITNEDIDNMNSKNILAVMMKFLAEIPETWGDKNDPETYLNLPVEAYLGMENAFSTAVQDLSKN